MRLRASLRGSLLPLAVNRAQRITRQGVLEVGEDELLMLLLVMQPQDERGPDLSELRLIGPIEKRFHPAVDGRAVVIDLGHRRPGEQAAPIARDTLAHGVVVRIKEIGILRIDWRFAGLFRRQDESLEEPRGMGQVPFDGAGVGHGLDDVVFRLQRRAEGLGGAAHDLIASPERVSIEARARDDGAGVKDFRGPRLKQAKRH